MHQFWVFELTNCVADKVSHIAADLWLRCTEVLVWFRRWMQETVEQCGCSANRGRWREREGTFE